MKIKLHNSLSKVDVEGYRFIFDDKIVVDSCTNSLCFKYKIDDADHFLSFLPKTNKLEEWLGFGEIEKESEEDWWKDPMWIWKEMSD